MVLSCVQAGSPLLFIWAFVLYQTKRGLHQCTYKTSGLKAPWHSSWAHLSLHWFLADKFPPLGYLKMLLMVLSHLRELMTLPKVLIAGLGYVYRWQEKSFPWGSVTVSILLVPRAPPERLPVTSGPPASELPLPTSIIQYQSEGPCRAATRQHLSGNFILKLSPLLSLSLLLLLNLSSFPSSENNRLQVEAGKGLWLGERDAVHPDAELQLNMENFSD